MSRAKVTVVIDTYNQERYVGAAIESVLEQDYPSEQVEIIVVDDGSTDATAREVARYKQRVSYIRQENQGQAAAINAGVERA
ncbi:MAG TPA: glycosyltransferase, partial [Blastocatellia bacterium]